MLIKASPDGRVASGNGELAEAAMRLAAEQSHSLSPPVGLTGGEAVVCTALASPASRRRRVS